jgi:hypothetical protein
VRGTPHGQRGRRPARACEPARVELPPECAACAGFAGMGVHHDRQAHAGRWRCRLKLRRACRDRLPLAGLAVGDVSVGASPRQCAANCALCAVVRVWCCGRVAAACCAVRHRCNRLRSLRLFWTRRVALLTRRPRGDAAPPLDMRHVARYFRACGGGRCSSRGVGHVASCLMRVSETLAAVRCVPQTTRSTCSSTMPAARSLL